jgi:hypothetical protein
VDQIEILNPRTKKNKFDFLFHRPHEHVPELFFHSFASLFFSSWQSDYFFLVLLPLSAFSEEMLRATFNCIFLLLVPRRVDENSDKKSGHELFFSSFFHPRLFIRPPH